MSDTSSQVKNSKPYWFRLWKTNHIPPFPNLIRTLSSQSSRTGTETATNESKVRYAKQRSKENTVSLILRQKREKENYLFHHTYIGCEYFDPSGLLAGSDVFKVEGHSFLVGLPLSDIRPLELNDLRLKRNTNWTIRISLKQRCTQTFEIVVGHKKCVLCMRVFPVNCSRTFWHFVSSDESETHQRSWAVEVNDKCTVHQHQARQNIFNAGTKATMTKRKSNLLLLFRDVHVRENLKGLYMGEDRQQPVVPRECRPPCRPAVWSNGRRSARPRDRPCASHMRSAGRRPLRTRPRSAPSSGTAEQQHIQQTIAKRFFYFLQVFDNKTLSFFCPKMRCVRNFCKELLAGSFDKVSFTHNSQFSSSSDMGDLKGPSLTKTPKNISTHRRTKTTSSLIMSEKW